MAKVFRIVCSVVLLLGCTAGSRAASVDESLLRRVMWYPSAITDRPDSMATNLYQKYNIHIKKRNFSMIGVPSLYYLVRDGKRNYVGESYSHVVYSDNRRNSRYTTNLKVSTVYHRHDVLDVLLRYMEPHFYETTLFGDYILSPLVTANRRFYRYEAMPWGRGGTRLFIRPKIKNTQLISGYIDVDDRSGRMTHFVLEGESDMVHFVLVGDMGTEGWKTLYPEKCTVHAEVKVTGNHIVSDITRQYNLPVTLPDSIRNEDNPQLLDSLRPIPLTRAEQYVINEYRTSRAIRQSIGISNERKSSNNRIIRHLFWDVIGENMLNRIHADLGANRKGHLRIGPIFNPLYFGYSKGKGVYYKFDLFGDYAFTQNSNLVFRTKMGYSFKQHQFFFDIPVDYVFNARREGYVQVGWANGNRITNSRILDEVIQEKHDSMPWNKMDLDYFRDMSVRLAGHYAILPNRLKVKGGIIVHRRSAVCKDGLIAAGRPTDYRSFAPFLNLQYLPYGANGPVITSQYERGLKGVFGSNEAYERYEFDGQYIHRMASTRNLQLRAGVGFYTRRSRGDYFLDYYNFHENYLPNGWGDEWSGEFELLESQWYNASRYYVRTNTTYESPLLMLSFLPKVGTIVEKERIYVSTLAVHRLFPYVEVGYGFVNRVFSMGAFCGFAPHHFQGFGIKLGFELFNNW